MTDFDNTKDLRWLGGCRPRDAEERFHSSYVVDLETGCWLWQGSPRGSNGYGRISVGGKLVPAHRYSWSLHNGPFDQSLMVCHKCDVPLCVNPDHLFLGTATDNMRDCKRKGRTGGGAKTPARGHNNGNSRLLPHEVKQIKALDLPQRRIAKMFGVSQALISKIKRNEMWRHING